MAPERDITLLLSKICKKCLKLQRDERYATVEDLIGDVEHYIEGLPEWGEPTLLSIDRKEDWQFQENIAIGKHMAINREADLLQWVNLMISKKAFPGNLKIELHFELESACQGLGVLFCLSDRHNLKSLDDGYCLSLGPERSKGFRFYRSGVEVWANEEKALMPDTSYHLVIEKIENQIHFSLNGLIQMRFHSQLSLSGTQVGLLLKDRDLRLSQMVVSLGSQHAMVNCLSVPDAFLTRKNYREALLEYRKIASSFSGRAEGREATFRAGLSLLEDAKGARQKSTRESLISQALEEFGKLRGTPGAPLEYVGKALVYSACHEIEEEAKCLELALRKFSHHPLRPIVVEHLISRLFDSAKSDRRATYHLALLALRYLPDFLKSVSGEQLLSLLEKHLEPLPFFPQSAKPQYTHGHSDCILAQ